VEAEAAGWEQYGAMKDKLLLLLEQNPQQRDLKVLRLALESALGLDDGALLSRKACIKLALAEHGAPIQFAPRASSASLERTSRAGQEADMSYQRKEGAGRRSLRGAALNIALEAGREQPSRPADPEARRRSVARHVTRSVPSPQHLSFSCSRQLHLSPHLTNRLSSSPGRSLVDARRVGRAGTGGRRVARSSRRWRAAAASHRQYTIDAP